MLVSVLPYEFAFGEHRTLWRKYAQRDQLIPWETARDYFVRPQVSIDLTTDPPTIGPIEVDLCD